MTDKDKERLKKRAEYGFLLIIRKEMADVFPDGIRMDAISSEITQDQQTVLDLIDRQPSDGDVLVEGNALFVLSETAKQYHELIMAVDRKYPGESRHNTALRYIREREERKDLGAERETT